MLHLNLSSGYRPIIGTPVPGVPCVSEFVYDLRSENLIVTPLMNCQTGTLTGILLQEKNPFAPSVGTVVLEKMSFSAVHPDAGESGILMEGFEASETEETVSILFSKDSIIHTKNKAEMQGLVCTIVCTPNAFEYQYALPPPVS